MRSRKQGRRKTNFKPSKEVTHVRRQTMKKQKRQEQSKEAAMDSDPEFEGSEVLNLLETIEPNMTKEQLERDEKEFEELEKEIAQELGSWKHTVSDGGDELTVVTPEKRVTVSLLCRGCGRVCGDAHKCDICGSNMHPFCGRGIGEEGHGQIIRCRICDSDFKQ